MPELTKKELEAAQKANWEGEGDPDEVEPSASAPEEDVWNVQFEDDADRLRWSQKNGAQRAFTVALGAMRGIAVLALLYIFIIGLDLLGSAFQIVGYVYCNICVRRVT